MYNTIHNEKLFVTHLLYMIHKICIAIFIMQQF